MAFLLSNRNLLLGFIAGASLGIGAGFLLREKESVALTNKLHRMPSAVPFSEEVTKQPNDHEVKEAAGDISTTPVVTSTETTPENEDRNKCKIALGYLAKTSLANATAQIGQFKRLIQLSPEQESKLLELFKNEDELSRQEFTPDEYDNKRSLLSSIEEILGAELHNQYMELLGVIAEKSTIRSNEEDLAFISRSLNLGNERTDELRKILNSPDRTTEGRFLFLSQELALTEDQEEVIRPIFAEIEQTGMTFTDEELAANEQEFDSNLWIKKKQEELKEKVGNILLPEQLKRLEQYQKEEVENLF